MNPEIEQMMQLVMPKRDEELIHPAVMDSLLADGMVERLGVWNGLSSRGAEQLRSMSLLRSTGVKECSHGPWLPISAAPRDGTRIVVSDGTDADVVQWCRETGVWRTRGGIRWEGAEWWVPMATSAEGGDADRPEHA